MAKWQGQSKGSLLGHQLFVFILQSFGLKPAYFILRFVAFYYFLFAKKSNKPVYFFYHHILKYKFSKAKKMVYKNYYTFGKTLLDKVAFLSGVKTNFTINHEGGEILDKIAANGKGGILISGHIGNWEIAGQLLNRLHTPFNILMYENEKQSLKKYMDQVQSQKNINIIAIKEGGGLEHMIELYNAFSRNELLVMHGDRYRDHTPTIETVFMGKTADFPAGPFTMAAKFGVPVTFAFAIKETNTHYHFFASEPIHLKRTRTKEQTDAAVQLLLKAYISEFEKIIRRYPEQWFNYYSFWKE